MGLSSNSILGLNTARYQTGSETALRTGHIVQRQFTASPPRTMTSGPTEKSSGNKGEVRRQESPFQNLLLEPEPSTLLPEFLQEHLHDSRLVLSSAQLRIPPGPPHLQVLTCFWRDLTYCWSKRGHLHFPAEKSGDHTE